MSQLVRPLAPGNSREVLTERLNHLVEQGCASAGPMTAGSATGGLNASRLSAVVRDGSLVRGARLAAGDVLAQGRPRLQQVARGGAAEDADADDVGEGELVAEDPGAAVEVLGEDGGGVGEALRVAAPLRPLFELGEPAVEGGLELGHPEQQPLVDEGSLRAAGRRQEAGVRWRSPAGGGSRWTRR